MERLTISRLRFQRLSYAGVGILLLMTVLHANAQHPRDEPIISSYKHLGEGPGKMKLLPGYVAGNPKRVICIDTECGSIWNPQGLRINYDIGGMAGVSVGKSPDPATNANYLWFGEASINGQAVRYAVRGWDRPEEIDVVFPSSAANFWAEVVGERDLETALRMLLTYQGGNYRPSIFSTIDGRLLGKDGGPISGAEVRLTAGATDRTTISDDQGHFRFSNLVPGTYEIIANVATESCKASQKKWRVKLDGATILLRSFTSRCR